MTRCALCRKPLDPDTAHQFHEEDCSRFLAGQCICDRSVCADCCPDDACVTPLAARLRIAHDEHVGLVEAEPDPEQAA